MLGEGRFSSHTKARLVSFGLFFSCCLALGRNVAPAAAQQGSGEPVAARQLTDYYLYDVTWGNAQFVAVGSGSLNATVALTSPDGVRWSKVSIRDSPGLLESGEKPGVLYGVAWNGTAFVAVGERILISPDGQRWMVAATVSTCAFTRVAANTSLFVAVGGFYGRGCLATSPDGRTWTDRTSALESNESVFADVIWTGSAFVALGNTNRGKFGLTSALLTSPDGETWTRQFRTNALLTDVAWNGALFVTVGSKARQGSIFTSPDGKTWTQVRVNVFDPLRAVAWGSKRFVTVGSSGVLVTSLDGKQWKARKSGTTADLMSITWNGSRFVAVGRGVILTSSDGETWKDLTSVP